MDTNHLNNGSGVTNGADKSMQRPAGVRPAGSRPAGIRPAGTQGHQPVNSSQQAVRPAGSARQTVTAQQPQNAGQARPAGQTGPARQPVVNNRPTSITGTQSILNKQPEETKEHIMQSTEHQRVIDSKHIEFTRDPNKKDYVLYMIIDKPVDGMLQYFRSYGLNVSKIFSHIDDARNALMMQVNPARIVIVDTGNGSFNSMSARKQVIDVIGLGDDENKVTIFYSDTNLKYEIEASKEIQKKALTWYKYKTTAHLLACMLQSKDCNYISDGGYSDASPIVSSLDETLWKNINFKDAEEHSLLPMINSSDVSKLVHDTNAEVIQGFTPIIR